MFVAEKVLLLLVISLIDKGGKSLHAISPLSTKLHSISIRAQGVRLRNRRTNYLHYDCSVYISFDHSQQSSLIVTQLS